MIAGTLLEALAALAVSMTVLGTLTAALAASGASSIAAWRLAYSLAESRQVEHVIDATVARTLGAAGGVTSCLPDEVVLESDLDRDGHVDSQSSERTAFVLAPRPGGLLALSQRLGRQSMTIAETLAGDARIRCFDRNGAETAEPLAIRLVEIPTAAGSFRTISIGRTL
jgi:hypothetical protein